MPRFFNPHRIAPPGSRYSHGVVHSAQSRRMVISGQVGLRADGTIPLELEEQMDVAWDNLIEVLREGGILGMSGNANWACMRQHQPISKWRASPPKSFFLRWREKQ
jgi:enamine deaminase RidA (YjgF/YER057c/UK114 family)